MARNVDESLMMDNNAFRKVFSSLDTLHTLIEMSFQLRKEKHLPNTQNRDETLIDKSFGKAQCRGNATSQSGDLT
jgi:hypothetical protein